MEPKPLTKERREQIAQFIAAGAPCLDGATEAEEFIRELLAAEAYWRMAASRADVFRGGEPCVFCDRVKGDEPDHAPDCAWVRARE